MAARELLGFCPCFVCSEPVHLRKELDPTGIIEHKYQHPMQATYEHITPLSEGGSGQQTNMAVSHQICNQNRHANPPKRPPPKLPPSARRLFSNLKHGNTEI